MLDWLKLLNDSGYVLKDLNGVNLNGIVLLNCFLK